MGEEKKYPPRTLLLDEIAHIVVFNEEQAKKLLIEHGINTPEHADSEWLVRVLWEKNTDYEINLGMLSILKENPYHQGCIHCSEPIQDVKASVRGTLPKLF